MQLSYIGSIALLRARGLILPCAYSRHFVVICVVAILIVVIAFDTTHVSSASLQGLGSALAASSATSIAILVVPWLGWLASAPSPIRGPFSY